MKFQKISKAQIKHIRLLQAKKYRQKYDQFMVEGLKSVNEFIHSPLECVALFGTQAILQQYSNDSLPCFELSNKELKQLSNFKNPQEIVGVFEQPKKIEPNTDAPFIIALDDMRDPGNMGTVIRTADWFGLSEIICSTTCVDAYNPKVIQASMGSLSRIHVHYVDLATFLQNQQSHQVVLADMEGTPYQNYKWNKDILVIGNEANGLGDYLEKMPHNKITINRKGKAESLNASISAAIVMAQVFA